MLASCLIFRSFISRTALREKFESEQAAGVLKNERLSLILATYQRNLELTEQKLVAAQQENIDLHIQIKQLVQNSSQLQHQLKDLSNSGKNQAPVVVDPELHVEGQPQASAAAAAAQQKEMQEQQQQQYMTMYAALTEQIKELKDHIQLSAIAAVSPGRVSKSHSAAAQGKAYSSIFALFGYITLSTVSVTIHCTALADVYVCTFYLIFLIFLSSRFGTRKWRKSFCFCRDECPAVAHLVASHFVLRESEFTCAADPAGHSASFSSHFLCERCGGFGEQSGQRGEHCARHAGEYHTARTGTLFVLFCVF